MSCSCPVTEEIFCMYHLLVSKSVQGGLCYVKEGPFRRVISLSCDKSLRSSFGGILWRMSSLRNQSHPHWRSSRERQPHSKQQRVSLDIVLMIRMCTKKSSWKMLTKDYPAQHQIYLYKSKMFFFTNSRASIGIMEGNLQGIINIQRGRERKSKERDEEGRANPWAFLYKPNIKWPDVQGNPMHFHSTSRNIIISKTSIYKPNNLQRRSNSSNPLGQTLNLPRIVCL